MDETRKMLKAEISKWIDRQRVDISRILKKEATEDILEVYEEWQDWDGDVMTSGKSVEEIREWLKKDPEDIVCDTLKMYEMDSQKSYNHIMHGLGFDKLAIVNAFETCVSAIQSVMAYAEQHGYKDDVKLLDIKRDTDKWFDDGFVNMVRDAVEASYASDAVYPIGGDNRAHPTNRVISCCYDCVSSLLESTRVCKELGVSFEYSIDKASVGELQLVCSEGTYENFENNVGEIFDRLAKQEKEKTAKSIERD